MKYTLQRKFWKFVGAELSMFDQNEQLVSFVKMKGWKLREQITAFQTLDMQTPLYHIQARQIIDIGATYDISDPAGANLGAWRRKGIMSIAVRDTWKLLDPNGNEIGMIQEDSAIMGVMRRLFGIVALIFPQNYNVVVNGENIAVFKRTFNLFVVRYNIEFAEGAFDRVDYRLLWSGLSMIAIMEATKG